jgi:hypothetical protein
MAARTDRSPFAALLSALLLYLFLVGYRVLAAAVIPLLLELMERAPRLAALGWLALLASPVAFVAVAHRTAHRAIDRFDRESRPSANLESVRQGFFAWFAISFASMTSACLLLAIFPPPPDEETFAALLRVAADVRLEAGVHALLWVGVAALLYHVDRAAHRS